MDIYEIKRRTSETSPFFFSGATLKFFGQTMRSWSVRKELNSDRYIISAPMRCNGKVVGQTIRYFNPLTNELNLK